MGRTLNRFSLLGRLTRDPEIKKTQSGLTVANIDLAQNKSKKKADGTYEDIPLYHRVTAFGKTAEFVENYIRKGAQILVEGEIIPYSYEQEDGAKKYGIKFEVKELLSLDKKGQANHEQPLGEDDLNDIFPGE